MDEHNPWSGEEKQGPEDDDQYEPLPASFALALVHQGPRGEYRTRNRTPGELQRSTVFSFQGGRDRQLPVFTVSCNALVMIHGRVSPKSRKQGTLLVYEFKFNSYRGTRIKNADVVFEFRPQNGRPSSISVAGLRPDVETRMLETEDIKTNKLIASVGTSMAPVGIQLGVSRSVQQVDTHHTVVKGDNPQDSWGNRYTARFFLSENQRHKNGIITKLRTAILLEREGDENFYCHPSITVEPSFAAYVATLGTARDPDDPIQFSVDEPPLNLLEDHISIDRDNLGATDLDGLSDCTFYHHYHGAIKRVN